METIKVQCNDSSQSIQKSLVSKNDSSRMPDLTFDRLQLSDQEYCGVDKRGFGRFIARGAVLDEEYWTAAWLRAEAIGNQCHICGMQIVIKGSMLNRSLLKVTTMTSNEDDDVNGKTGNVMVTLEGDNWSMELKDF